MRVRSYLNRDVIKLDIEVTKIKMSQMITQRCGMNYCGLEATEMSLGLIIKT